MEVESVRTLLPSPGSPRVDSKRTKKDLDILDPLVANYGKPDGASLEASDPGGDVPIRLEEAAKVGNHLFIRGGPELLRHPNLGSTGFQVPTLYEWAQHLSVQADSPAGDGAELAGVLRRDFNDKAMHIGQSDVEVLYHPVDFVIVSDLEFDG